MQSTPASPDNEAIRELRDSSKRLEKLMEKLSKTTEELSVSSKGLEKLMEKLSTTTEELSVSSKGLEKLTRELIFLTILLVVMTMILPLMEGEGIPFVGKIFIIIFIFILYVFLKWRYK